MLVALGFPVAAAATLRKTILSTIDCLLVLGILGLVAVHVIGLPDPLMGRSP